MASNWLIGIIGSLNVDHVCTTSHVCRAGETLSSLSYTRHVGGKGLNQAVAVARACRDFGHARLAGKVGRDGVGLVEKLEEWHVTTKDIIQSDQMATGMAFIQVVESSGETKGENAIILYPGANHCITQGEINSWLDKWIQSSNDTAIRCILLQNEIGQLSLTHAIQEASARGIPIVFNPAPMTEDIPSLLGTRMPTGVTSYLVNLTLNETEFHTILASADLQSKPALRDPAFWDMMQHGEIHPTTHPNLFESTQGPPGPVETPTPYSLCHRLAGLLGALVGLRTWLKSHGHERCEVILTRGRKGLVYVSPITATLVVMDAWHGPIAVEDTTGAGDTWLGYYAALRMAGGSGSCALEATPLFALAGASVAAAIATTQAGAAQAIPHRDACQACWRDAHVGIPWWSFSPISK